MAVQPSERSGRRSDAKWRTAGWLIVGAAVIVAVLVALVVGNISQPGSVHHAIVSHRTGPSARTSGTSQRPFNYCARRSAMFSAGHPFIGITDPLVASYENKRDCALGLMAAAHIGYFRATIAWPNVEPTPGVYYFAHYDQLVAELARHHMDFLPTLLGSPRWVSTGPAGGRRFASYPPASPSEFAAFAALCVRRYGPRGAFWRANPRLPYYPVRAWQVWNEPNLVEYWRPKTDPAAYVRLLKATYHAIKAADQRAIIVTAGMPFFTAEKEQAFLTGLFRSGMSGNFDALSVHSYSPLQAPARLKLARTLMNRFGARNAQLWSTELAWASGPPDPWSVNQRTQATAIKSFFGWVGHNRERLKLGEVMWYSWQDHIYGRDPSWWGFHLGLLTLKLQPKPALRALASLPPIWISESDGSQRARRTARSADGSSPGNEKQPKDDEDHDHWAGQSADAGPLRAGGRSEAVLWSGAGNVSNSRAARPALLLACSIRARLAWEKDAERALGRRPEAPWRRSQRGSNHSIG